MTVQNDVDTPQLARWKRFRGNRESALAAEHGWLTLTSYEWLRTTASPVGNLPGLWRTNGTTAFLEADAADGYTLVETGEPAVGTLAAELGNGDSLLWVQRGSVAVELVVRSGSYAIRTRDSASPVRTEFRGVPTFGYRPDLVLTGRFEAYPEPRQVSIGTYLADVREDAILVGEASFTVDGCPQRLAAEQGPLGSLIFTFHDSTNGVSTDGWRKLETPRPRPDGTVVLDFNRTVNYPSAFTDFGTCPMPVGNNVVDAPIPAGEKKKR
ncbi:MAG: DUF1684 domain-containing protein [Actinomycetales bacterium]